MNDTGFDERRARQILDARTRTLAARDAKAKRQEAMQRLLGFTVGSDLYGLPIADVARVMPFSGCTPVPGAKAGILGIIGVRGQIHTVLDASVLLHGVPSGADGATGHLILLRWPPPRLSLFCARALGVTDVKMLSAGERPHDGPRAVPGYGLVEDAAMAPAGTSLAIIDLARLLAAFRSDNREPSR